MSPAAVAVADRPNRFQASIVALPDSRAISMASSKTAAASASRPQAVRTVPVQNSSGSRWSRPTARAIASPRSACRCASPRRSRNSSAAARCMATGSGYQPSSSSDRPSTSAAASAHGAAASPTAPLNAAEKAAPAQERARSARSPSGRAAARARRDHCCSEPNSSRWMPSRASSTSRVTASGDGPSGSSSSAVTSRRCAASWWPSTFSTPAQSGTSRTRTAVASAGTRSRQRKSGDVGGDEVPGGVLRTGEGRPQREVLSGRRAVGQEVQGRPEPAGRPGGSARQPAPRRPPGVPRRHRGRPPARPARRGAPARPRRPRSRGGLRRLVRAPRAAIRRERTRRRRGGRVGGGSGSGVAPLSTG